MILITANEWLGPSMHLTLNEQRELHLLPPMERLVGICSVTPFPKAVWMLDQYQKAFNDRHRTLGVTYTVLSVCEIAELDSETMAAGNMLDLEAMYYDIIGEINEATR